MTQPLWIIFAILVAAMLALDLGYFNRKHHEPSFRAAILMSGIWIGAALFFNACVWYFMGHTAALEFLTAYLVEESLSVDNLFVFLMLFSYFSVPRTHQRKVLFWGILGVVVLRGIFIVAGVELLERFRWMIYVFGALLIFTGIKMAVTHGKELSPEANPVLKLMRRFVPVTAQFEGERFFVKQAGRLMVTPLFVVLMVVESTDVVFAVDSIPAVFGITTNLLIVYTSNILAVMGLRALYFALAGFMRMFHLLGYGLALILVFIGVKMCIAAWVHVPIAVALGVVAGILTLSVIASVVFPKTKEDI